MRTCQSSNDSVAENSATLGSAHMSSALSAISYRICGRPLVMWSNLRSLPLSLLGHSGWMTQSNRSTHILRRIRSARLNKLSANCLRKQKKTAYYYELVKDTDLNDPPVLDVVLVKDVPGVGMCGEKIQGTYYNTYMNLLLPKLAVYANSPEAQNRILSKNEIQYSSKFSKIVENHLADKAIPIILSHDTEWKLEPWHVKLALRRAGILVNEDCITLPEKVISGPNLQVENKDFLIKLTMNKSETFSVRCRIYHFSKADPLVNKNIFDVYSDSEPLFPEDKEKIESIIKREKEIKERAKSLGI